MIRGIIFDADGTLLDSMHIWAQLGARYLDSIGKTAEAGLDRILYPMSLEESCAYLKAGYNLTDPQDKIIGDIIKIIEEFYLYEVKTKAGADDFLKEMKNRRVPMIVATSSDKRAVELAFNRLGILECFEGIITCSELKTSKREPEIYLRCAEVIGTSPKDTAVFEDVLCGIQAAKRAGFKTYAVEDNSSKADWNEIKKTADYCISDFARVNLTDFEKGKEAMQKCN